MITKEQKKEWIAALRSGKYMRGTGRLRKDGLICDRYCCLGVLADLISPNGWHRPDEEEIDYFQIKLNGYNDYYSCTLPVDIISFGNQSDLIDMNDAKDGTSFDEIPDWIEKNVPTKDS